MPLVWWFREHAMSKAEYAHDLRDTMDRYDWIDALRRKLVNEREVDLYQRLFGRDPDEW